MGKLCYENFLVNHRDKINGKEKFGEYGNFNKYVCQIQFCRIYSKLTTLANS